MIALTMRHAVPLLALLVACSSGMKNATSEDHYSESGTIGNMQVKSEVSGDAVAVSFAPVPAGWKDPRPQVVGDLPAWIARAKCTVKATKAGDQYRIEPNQSCKLDDRTLSIERGFVWMQDSVLNVDIAGKYDNGGSYSLQYPFGVVEPALKAH